jgi:hypothetical protein
MLNRLMRFKRRQFQFYGWIFLSTFLGTVGADFFGVSSTWVFNIGFSSLIGLFLLMVGLEVGIGLSSKRWNTAVAKSLERSTFQDLPQHIVNLEVFAHEFSAAVGNDSVCKLDWKLKRRLWNAIAYLLKQVDEENSEVLTEFHWKVLRDILRHESVYKRAIEDYDSHDARMHFAIILTMQKVGNRQDLAVLHEVAGGKVSDIPAGVRRKAERAMAALEARIETQFAQQHLLRASQVRWNDDQLLRPAAGGQTEPPNELLRAGVERN